MSSGNSTFKILFLSSREKQIRNFFAADTKLVKGIAFDIITDKRFFKGFRADTKAGVKKLSRYDLGIVYSYGGIIPTWALEVLPMFNIHFSLLPKYRGAYPVQASLLNGEKKIGITWHIVVDKVDAGNILLQKEVELNDKLGYSAKEVFESLEQINFKLFEYLLFAENWAQSDIQKMQADTQAHVYFDPFKTESLLFSILHAIKNNKGLKQDEKMASYVTRDVLSINNSFVNFKTQIAIEIYNRVRAFNNEPIARTFVNFMGVKRELLLYRVKFANNFNLKPGQVLFVKKRGLLVGTLLGTLKIVKASFAGKKILEGLQFLSLKGKILGFI